jgi:hypothetical protein
MERVQEHYKKAVPLLELTPGCERETMMAQNNG